MEKNLNLKKNMKVTFLALLPSFSTLLFDLICCVLCVQDFCADFLRNFDVLSIFGSL